MSFFSLLRNLIILSFGETRKTLKFYQPHHATEHLVLEVCNGSATFMKGYPKLSTRLMSHVKRDLYLTTNHWLLYSVFKVKFANTNSECHSSVVSYTQSYRQIRDLKQQERQNLTKGLMSKTTAVHVRYKSLFTSLPSCAK